MFEDLSINLLASLIYSVAGFLGAIVLRYAFVVVPEKRLWSLNSPQSLVICTATTQNDTGKYIRDATGIGQVRSLTYIIRSLTRGYRKVNFENILLSEEQIKDKIEDDLILLGGPKNNKVSRAFFEKIDNLNIVQHNVDGYIYWQKTNKVFRAEFDNKAVSKDYGLIIKMFNPFSSNTRNKLILFSGNHTYGTLAAARFYCSREMRKLTSKINQNICILVSCKVQDGYSVSIKLEDYLIF